MALGNNMQRAFMHPRDAADQAISAFMELPEVSLKDIMRAAYTDPRCQAFYGEYPWLLAKRIAACSEAYVSRHEKEVLATLSIALSIGDQHE